MKITRNIITKLIVDYKRLHKQVYSLNISGSSNDDAYIKLVAKMEYIEEILLFIGYKEIELADLLTMDRLTYGGK